MEVHNLIGFVLLYISVVAVQAVPYNKVQSSPCSGVQDGFYINAESDCKVYTYCHQGVGDVFRCLPGTVFSEAENICVSADSVSCNPAYRQEVTSSASSHNALGSLDSAEQIQQDLASLREKVERVRALRAQQESQKKRQIKFRQLRDLLDNLKTTLEDVDSGAGNSQGQPK